MADRDIAKRVLDIAAGEIRGGYTSARRDQDDRDDAIDRIAGLIRSYAANGRRAGAEAMRRAADSNRVMDIAIKFGRNALERVALGNAIKSLMLEACEQPPTPATKGRMTDMADAQIKHMVDRFLQWKLPENFNPDCGITFKPTYNENNTHGWPVGKYEPVGTNLFSAAQATEMVRYMLEGLPLPDAPARGAGEGK